MDSLLERVTHYDTVERPRHRQRFHALAETQAPAALFLTCSDSRIVPNLVARASPGELFVVRNVANLVAPAGVTEDASVSSALFYALTVLHVRDVIVCGHSSCGGIGALLQPTLPPQLRRWLATGERSLEMWRRYGPLDASRSDDDQLSQVSTVIQSQNLLTYDFVRERVARDEVRIHAWWFDIGQGGRLLGYSRTQDRFVDVAASLQESALESAAE